jgi:hypothetical protein
LSSDDTLAVLAEEVARALDPLGQALTSPEALRDFLRELGWNFSATPQPIRDIATTVQDISATVGAGITADNAPVLMAKLARLVRELDELATEPSGSFPVPDPAAFVAEFPEQLIKHLIAMYLLQQHPLLAGLLRVAGVVTDDEVAATGTRLRYRRRSFDWDRFARIVGDPFGGTRARYNWGGQDIELRLLLDDVQQIASGLGIPSRVRVLDDASFAYLTQGASTTDDRYRFVLRWHLFERIAPSKRAWLGVAVAGTPPPSPTGKAGIAVLPFVDVDFTRGIELPGDVDVVFEAEAALDSGVAVTLHPEQPVKVVSDIFTTDGGMTGLPPSTAAVSAGFEQRRETGEAVVLLGSRPGNRLEYTSLALMAGARLGAGGRPSASVELRLRGAAAVIEPGADADSFLARLLPSEGLRVGADVDVGVDSIAGLYLKGSAGLEIRYPVHISLGPIDLLGLRLALRAEPARAALPISVGADIKGRLGPVTAVVEDVGFTAVLDFEAGDKNIGIAALRLGFKPPNGVGLAIDAGVVKGGGYLFLDPERGEYAGALELTITGLLSLRAVGLITTRMPDGTPGFSLIVILTAEFVPGLQLGFGFTLVGIGGLLGLNRTIRLDALAQGVRTGSVNSILFPRDVVANAPRILSDLRAIFPPQEGRFLVGPMAKLGWGTPTIVSLSLGVIIEIPGNVAIVGVLRVSLPTEDAPILLLQVSFVGALEFDRKRVWFFATLFDSRVLWIPLGGEMGLLMAYGDDPNFVVSVGGFHPLFSPPPLPFPSPGRIVVPILSQPAARITAQGYFAVTSNTAQFGARAELFFGFDSFSVDGFIGFDALFRFSPFSFLIQVGASVSLRAFGVGMFSIHLDFTLEGPTPWHARGRGSISLFFFDISANFDFSWGESRDTTLPPIQVLPLVKAEYEKQESWRASLPPTSNLLVSIRSLDEAGDALVLHPLGTLRISQRAVPLQLMLDRVGAQRPADVNRLTVEPVSADLERRGDVGEQFALAQFKDLTDAEKLTQRAFEQQPAGIELAARGSQLVTPRAVKRVVRYEQILIDSFYKRFSRPLFLLFGGLFRHFLAANATTASALSQAHRSRVRPFADDGVAIVTERFVVANRRDNTPAVTAFASEALARDQLAREVERDPNAALALHVIPEYEAQAA